MRLKNKIILIFLFVGMILLFNVPSYAGTQSLNLLEYDATLNEDGSMDVVEVWDIYVSETNTLFKDFNLDSSKYSGITNVKVTDVDRGIDLTQIDTEMYYVTQDCYYGLEIEDNVFEIAWGVGLDHSSDTKKYKISYTIEDAITVYNDCSQLYWQFIGVDNGVPADKITGQIHLPTAVKNIDNLRVWAHGPLNGEIRKQDNQTVWFEVDNLSTNTMLEVRVAVEESIFPLALKKENRNMLDEILAEETEWAEEANRQRNQMKLLFVIYGIIFIWFFTRILKYRKQLKEMPESFSKTINIGEYFRDIPRENAEHKPTPAQAAFLYGSKNLYLQHIFAGTMLDLCLKGYISFECENKKDIKINILKEDCENNLEKDEKAIFILLRKVARAEKSLTILQLEKYAKTYFDSFNGVMDQISDEAKDANERIGNYNKENEEIIGTCATKIGIYVISIIATIYLIAILFPIIIEWIISIIYLRKISKKVNLLTEQGETEKQQWKGLARYMKDFSLLKYKEVPDLVLWEKYLVYATTFGISKEVVKQLKVVYPEFNNLDNSTFRYMYLMSDSRFEHGFENTFNDSIKRVYSSYQSAYNAAHSSSSSGSGGGGGFSSGGGGRRRRWPEWAEDKNF